MVRYGMVWYSVKGEVCGLLLCCLPSSSSLGSNFALSIDRSAMWRVFRDIFAPAEKVDDRSPSDKPSFDAVGIFLAVSTTVSDFNLLALAEMIEIFSPMLKSSSSALGSDTLRSLLNQLERAKKDFLPNR